MNKLYLVDGNKKYTYRNVTRIKIMDGKLSFHYVDKDGDHRSELGNLPDEITLWESDEQKFTLEDFNKQVEESLINFANKVIEEYEAKEKNNP